PTPSPPYRNPTLLTIGSITRNSIGGGLFISGREHRLDFQCTWPPYRRHRKLMNGRMASQLGFIRDRQQEDVAMATCLVTNGTRRLLQESCFASSRHVMRDYPVARLAK